MEDISKERIRQTVRERCAGVAKGCCSSQGLSNSPSCSGSLQDPVENRAFDLGYSREEVTKIPEGANMGLGCGNPTAMASLKPGETVLDLGSGGGIDCFLAAAGGNGKSDRRGHDTGHGQQGEGKRGKGGLEKRGIQAG